VEVLIYVGDGEELHRFLAIRGVFVGLRLRWRGRLSCAPLTINGANSERFSTLWPTSYWCGWDCFVEPASRTVLPHLPLWLTRRVISRDVLLLIGLVGFTTPAAK